MGKSSFKGSRGWLEKWKERYSVKQLEISGESADVWWELWIPGRRDFQKLLRAMIFGM